jgi:tRNA(adenine34) deaminase
MDHERWMREALEEAEKATATGDVPVGAVVVFRERIIGRGRNRKEAMMDPTAHAEILALRRAAHERGTWRLTGAMLYSTLEPCAMCAGAMVNARIDRLVYGLADPKTGAAGSVYDIVRSPWLNHRMEVVAGVLAEDVEGVMRDFFDRLREERA